MRNLICVLAVLALGALPACASTTYSFGSTNNVSFNGGTEGSWTEANNLSGQQIVCVVGIGTTTNTCGDPGPGTANSIPITAPGTGTLPGGVTNYAMIDGDPQYGAPIYTDMTGLTVGDSYTISFYQASSEETGATPPTAYDDSWLAFLLPTSDTSGTYICPQAYCGTHSTETAAPAGSTEAFNGSTSQYMQNPAGGSTPWELESFTFTATAASQVLEFVTNVATGTDGTIAEGTSFVPPLLDLADVTLTQNSSTPEPSTWGLTLLGVGVAFAASKLRRRFSARK